MKKNLKKTIAAAPITAAEIKASLNRSDYDYDTYIWVIADAKYHAYDLNSPFSDDEKELYDSFVAGTDYNPAD